MCSEVRRSFSMIRSSIAAASCSFCRLSRRTSSNLFSSRILFLSAHTTDNYIEQALAALGEVQRRYPETRYAADAALKIDLVNDHLAGKEMEIGRFYERRNQWLAATLRFREVVDKYETTTHAPEALYRLVESYLSLGIPLEAKKAAAVLGTNYPGSKWYERAYDLMQDKAPSYV